MCLLGLITNHPVWLSGSSFHGLCRTACEEALGGNKVQETSIVCVEGHQQSGFLAHLCIACVEQHVRKALRSNNKVHQLCIGPAGLSLASGHVWGCLDPEKQLDKLAWSWRGGLCNCAALHSEAGEWSSSMSPHLLP